MERAWGRPDAATAAVRLAVRATLAELGPVTSCSSPAAAAPTPWRWPRRPRSRRPRLGAAGRCGRRRPRAPGRARSASRPTAAESLRGLGLDPVEVVRGPRRRRGRGARGGGPRGPLRAPWTRPPTGTAPRSCSSGTPSTTRPSRCSSASTRGAGARSLAGMPAARGRLPPSPARRSAGSSAVQSLRAAGPDLVGRPDERGPRLRRGCAARRALADLERDLGPGVAAALARTASLLREDADHLDALADEAVTGLGPGPVAGRGARRHPARGADAGVAAAARRGRARRAGQVGTRHTDACDRLLTAWHGQGPVHAPGDLRVAPIRRSRHHRPPPPVE